MWIAIQDLPWNNVKLCGPNLWPGNFPILWGQRSLRWGQLWQFALTLITMSLFHLSQLILPETRHFFGGRGQYWASNSKALCLQGRHSTTWAVFAVVALEIGPHFLPRPPWATILLFYTFCFCWDNEYDHGTQFFPFFLHWGEVLQTFLWGLTWNWDPPDLSLLNN
jgi:hypothetical protein